MGCSLSTLEDSSLRRLNGRRGRNCDRSSAHTQESESTDAEFGLNSKWEAGFLDTNYKPRSVNTFTDSGGRVVRIADNASRDKADTICQWLDNALAERKCLGGVFYDVQNLEEWSEVLLKGVSDYCYVE